jgi:hypothetical protein
MKKTKEFIKLSKIKISLSIKGDHGTTSFSNDPCFISIF